MFSVAYGNQIKIQVSVLPSVESRTKTLITIFTFSDIVFLHIPSVRSVSCSVHYFHLFLVEVVEYNIIYACFVFITFPPLFGMIVLSSVDSRIIQIVYCNPLSINCIYPLLVFSEDCPLQHLLIGYDKCAFSSVEHYWLISSVDSRKPNLMVNASMLPLL